MLSVFRKEDDDLTTKSLPDVRDDDLRHVFEICGRGQVTTEIVERGCLRFASNGGFGLFAFPRGERTDDKADREKHGKGDKVFRVVDRKGVIRRDKEKVKSQHACNCGKQGWTASEKNRRDDHRSQIEHDQIGWLKVAAHGKTKQGGKGNQTKAKQVTSNRTMRLPVGWDDGLCLPLFAR